MKDKIKIGIISFEHMHGLSYTNALTAIDGVEIVGIADDNEFRGTQMASRFNTKHYNDYHDLLKTDVDGVIICTNNKLHCQVSVDAANAKKHILVEKPFAISAEDAQMMLEAAKKNDVKIMNAFPVRFNPNVIEAKRMIDNGEIGDILCMTGINHGKIPSGWFLDKNLSGGGGVMDHTVHLADIMRWYTGSEFKSVYCESGDLIHNKGIDDCGIVNAEFENGVFVTIDCSWAHHSNYTIWPQVDLQIIGTKGALDVKAFGQIERVVDAQNNIIQDVVFSEDGDEGLIREFVDVCKTGREPNASGYDGARAMDVAIAAYESTITHKPVLVKTY